MINRTDKVLIGKDITRDAQVVAGATIVTISASTGLADGEIVVLDKNKTVLNEAIEYIRRFECLLDTCNGLALAYKKFFFLRIPDSYLTFFFFYIQYWLW